MAKKTGILTMKTYSDSTLKHQTKDELIAYIRNLEHNLDNAIKSREESIDLNTKLVKLLNKNEIEWVKVNSLGIYEVIDI